MKKHPGTAGTMPVKGTGCGIRPDLDEIGEDTGFDFSDAAALLESEQSPPRTTAIPAREEADSEKRDQQR